MEIILELWSQTWIGANYVCGVLFGWLVLVSCLFFHSTGLHPFYFSLKCLPRRSHKAQPRARPLTIPLPHTAMMTTLRVPGPHTRQDSESEHPSPLHNMADEIWALVTATSSTSRLLSSSRVEVLNNNVKGYSLPLKVARPIIGNWNLGNLYF